MDSISEASTALADLAPDPVDLDAIMRFGVGADALAGAPSVPAAPSTALALPPAPPPTLRERFEGLSQVEQAAVLAIAAAVLVTGIGWAIGAAAGKAAVTAAAVAI